MTLVADLLARCTFPPAGSAVVAAVSGGADSLALLVLATEAGLEVTAVHVEHGLRPGAPAEADLVAAAAARFGAGFESRPVTVAPGADLEARARRARYDALPFGVLVGHTADDRAETVVLNLLRGAGLDGLGAMAPGGAGDRVRRPLLGLRRHETAALCSAVGLAPIHDPSNDDLRFRRNQVRHRLLPLLDEVAGRDVVPVVVRQAAILRDEAALLDRLAADLDPTDARAVAEAPRALARRAVRRWLRDAGDDEHHPPPVAAVERVLAVARGEAVACELPGGRSVRRSAGRLTLGPLPDG